MQSHNRIILGLFSNFFCSFLTRHIKKIMTTCKIISTLTTKEPKICYALATTSAFNLILCHMWNVDTMCTSLLDLDKENHWPSTPAVAPDGWVQGALHNPSLCCSQSPLDGAALNDLGIKSSQAVTYPNICGAKPCLSMITWQALYPRPRDQRDIIRSQTIHS